MLVRAHELESVRAAPRHKPRAFLALLGAHSISAGMAAHIAAGAAAMPLHALPYAHRRLALPPVCASRLWPSGGAVARPCARCAASRGPSRYFQRTLAQVAGSVDVTRARRRDGARAAARWRRRPCGCLGGSGPRRDGLGRPYSPSACVFSAVACSAVWPRGACQSKVDRVWCLSVKSSR